MNLNPSCLSRPLCPWLSLSLSLSRSHFVCSDSYSPLLLHSVMALCHLRSSVTSQGVENLQVVWPSSTFPAPPAPLFPLPLVQLSFNIKHAINARFSFRKNVKNLQHKKGGNKKLLHNAEMLFLAVRTVWEPNEALPINCIPNTFIVCSTK